MKAISKNYIHAFMWTGALLLCASLMACSSDSTIWEEDSYEGVPMQFSQAAISNPVSRSSSTNYLTQGFLVSCWKGYNTDKQFITMDKYEVKYQSIPWDNLSKWDYVGSTSEGYYQSQIERYLECIDGSNVNDFDLLTGNTIQKDRTMNGATTDYERYVALPFHHFTSKVRFAVYNNYRKETPNNFYLNNVKVRVVSDNFVTGGNGYEANLKISDMLNGTFTVTTKAATEEQKILLQTDDSKQGNLNTAIDREHAYFCECQNGMLQIPQHGVRMTVSFDVCGLDYENDFTSPDGSIVYDKATKTIHYIDIPIKDTKTNMEYFHWESNNIYTYVIKITEFYPLSIDFSAELIPWTDVYGNIETNLEK